MTPWMKSERPRLYVEGETGSEGLETHQSDSREQNH